MRAFISRNRDKAESLAIELEKRGAEVECVALIETVAIEYIHPLSNFDWIFFSSRNCVKHFFAANPVTSNAKLAAIGPMTAKALVEFGTVDFVGSSNKTDEVTIQFADTVGADKVLFPISKSSLQRIQSGLSADQVTNLVCYETVLEPRDLSVFDVYLFTSPSNVRSFAERNDFPINSLYLAGPTTCKELLKQGVGNPISLSNWKESTMLDAIFSKRDC